MSLTPRLPAVGPSQAEDGWGVRRSAPFILSTIVVGHCKPEGMTRSGLPWNAPRKSKAWKQASKAWRIKAGPPAEATYSGTDRARGARRPLCDEGTSHLKTQINYSFPTNEQPPGSGTSHRTADSPGLGESHRRHRSASRRRIPVSRHDPPTPVSTLRRKRNLGSVGWKITAGPAGPADAALRCRARVRQGLGPQEPPVTHPHPASRV